MNRFSKIFAVAVASFFVFACSASSGDAPASAQIDVGSYVQRDGYIQVFAPGEDGGPLAQPLTSLVVERKSSSIEPEMMAGPGGGGKGKGGGGGYCCTGCQSTSDGGMICAECHTC